MSFVLSFMPASNVSNLTKSTLPPGAMTRGQKAAFCQFHHNILFRPLHVNKFFYIIKKA